MAKLIDFITVPAARASILWLIGEYCERVPKIAPDVLRKLAKSFIEEVNFRSFYNSRYTNLFFESTFSFQENIVKLQVLNLAVKLYLTNPEQTQLLCQYLFSLARYDENYDIRDRARFLKPFIFPANGATILSKNAKKIFLAPKPAPLLESKYQGREQYQLGSLSHYLNITANGYHDLPAFPKVAPDTSVRGVETANENSNDTQQHDNVETQWSGTNSKQSSKSNKKDKSFYSESENESSSVDESSDSSSSSETESGTDSNEDDEESGSEKSEDESNGSSDESDSGSSSGSTSGSDDGSSSNDSVDASPKQNSKKAAEQSNSKEKQKQNNAPPAKQERSNLDLLLELDDIAPGGPIMTPSLGKLNKI